MATPTLTVRGGRVVTPDGVRPASIHIEDGRIVRVAEYADRPSGVRTIDAGEAVVLPGIVDTHVHVNEPGRTDWEGFAHATRAAAAGGITTMVDMPLNSVPATTTAQGIEAKQRAATGACAVDIGFWGGVVPGNAAALEPLARAGVLGFKCFLAPSGVEEFPHVSEDDLRAALPVVARLGAPLLVHAECPALLREPRVGASRRSHATWLETRPAASEIAAIDLLVRLAREYGARVHVVHLSAVDALPSLRSARASGLPLTVETCPHYLAFAAEEIPDGATAFKCAPPIRARENRDGLWRALVHGDIDLIASDHSPAPASMKCVDSGDFFAAWGGIASLQVALSAVWTGAAARGIPIERVSGWLAAAPARLAGLERVKGSIAPGVDADLVLFQPDEEWLVDARSLYHRHPITPYDAMRLRGTVAQTILRGEVVFERGEAVGQPRGRLLGPRFQLHSTA